MSHPINTATRKRVVTLLFCLMLIALTAVCNVLPIKAADTTNTKILALTFDDGPSQYTDTLLDILSENNATATFAVPGIKISTNQQILEKALSQDCEIIGHTWNHVDLTSLTDDQIRQQLQDANKVLKETLDINPKAFRPTFGTINSNVIDIAKDLDLSIILWDISTLDWDKQDADAIYAAIMTRAHNGAIILCHDTIKETTEAMQRVIPELISKGYSLITVSELIGETQAGSTYINGLNNCLGTVYTIQQGDTLNNIAKNYHTTPDAIMALNGLSGDWIYVGQLLAIPQSECLLSAVSPDVDSNNLVYVVQSGDSLWLIARAYGTSVDVIVALNGLSGDRIYVGQLLLIPQNGGYC